MCISIKTDQAVSAGEGTNLYFAPTGSQAFPIGLGLMQWPDDDMDAVAKQPSYNNSVALSVEQAITLRESLDRNIELAQAGALVAA